MSGDTHFVGLVAQKATNGGEIDWDEAPQYLRSHRTALAIEAVGKTGGYSAQVLAIGQYRQAVSRYKTPSGRPNFALAIRESDDTRRGHRLLTSIGRACMRAHRVRESLTNANAVPKQMAPLAGAELYVPTSALEYIGLDVFGPVDDTGTLVPVGVNGDLVQKSSLNGTAEKVVRGSYSGTAIEAYRDLLTKVGYAPADDVVATLVRSVPSYPSKIRTRLERDGWKFERRLEQHVTWVATPPETEEERRAKLLAQISEKLAGTDAETLTTLLGMI